MLSDLMARQAKSTGKPYALADFDGLYLYVSAIGTKAWHFRYSWFGKRERITLGNYPALSLKDARALRDEARSLLAKGVNPHSERKRKRHAIVLATPWQARDRGVLEQAARLGDRAQVVTEEAQVELAERAALRAWMQVRPQRAQVVLPIGFVLRVELHHPRVLVQFVEGVLQRILQGIAGLPQPDGLAPFGTDRLQLEERRHRLAIFEQHALRGQQVLDSGQQVGEGRRHVVERRVVGLRRGSPMIRPKGGARCVDAVRSEAVDMPRPGVRLDVGLDWPGGRTTRPRQSPAHQ